MPTEPRGRTYLITGGASLIGSHLTDALLGAGAREVRLLDNFSLGTPDTIAHLADEPRVRLIRGDILRLNEVIDSAEGADGIFALAGFLTLPMAQNPALGVAVNTTGLLHTLEAARIARVRRVVFSSSVAAYGNAEAETLTEEVGTVTAGLQPVSAVYGTSKLFGEALGLLYAQKYGVQFTALRFASVYGERQHGRAVNANFIAETHERIRRGERPVIVGDGREVHDYIHVTDIAAGCMAAMAGDASGLVLNLATGVDTTLTDVVRLVLEACGATHLTPEYREDRRAVRSAGGTRLNFSRAKAEREIGWVPRVPLAEGIRRYVAWRESVQDQGPAAGKRAP
jgi:UDP-glucose 4-epimerase